MTGIAAGGRNGRRTLTSEGAAGRSEIVVQTGALARVAELVEPRGNMLVVTDDGVPAAYLECVMEQLPRARAHVIPHGERSKSLVRFEEILSTMLDAGFARGDCVVALGGGVVGDLGGFCAACYMRGIDFYNIPTTLLAQVDSSVGGKTAVDLGGAKNAVGAFWMPRRVIVDPGVLSTLDIRQFRAGFAEMAKMAATCDEGLFAELEGFASMFMRGDGFCGSGRVMPVADSEAAEVLCHLIYESIRIKSGVVSADPREAGLRRVLNFGHTIGHAIESCAHGALLHGECVAVGMLPLSSPSARARLESLLTTAGLPTSTSMDSSDLRGFLRHDKKMRADGITAVKVEEIGSFAFQTMTVDELCICFDEWKKTY